MNENQHFLTLINEEIVDFKFEIVNEQIFSKKKTAFIKVKPKSGLLEANSRQIFKLLFLHSFSFYIIVHCFLMLLIYSIEYHKSDAEEEHEFDVECCIRGLDKLISCFVIGK